MDETTPSGVSQDSVASDSSDVASQFDSLADAGILGERDPDPRERAQVSERKPRAAAKPEATAQASEEAPTEEVTPEGEQQPESEGEEEGETYASLEDYFSKANVDFESIRSLPVTVKIDGQTKSVPLAEVLKSYQLEGHVNNKSIQLSEQQKAFEAERAQAQQFVASQIQAAQSLGQLAQQQLTSEYQQINWEALKAADPGQYAMRMMDFQQRQAAIQNHMQQTQVVAQQSQQQAQYQQQQQLLASLPVEQQKLMQYRAEWADSTKFDADKTAAVSAGRKIGFTDAEITQWANWDSRFIIALDKIARFDALQAAAPEAAKRVRAAPPMPKAGSRVNRNPAQVNRNQLRERFQANPRDEEVGAAFFDTLI